MRASYPRSVRTRPNVAVVAVTSVQPMSERRTTLQLAGSVVVAAAASAAMARSFNASIAASAAPSATARRVTQLLTLKVRNRMIFSAQIEQAFSPVPGQNAQSILSAEFGNRKSVGRAGLRTARARVEIEAVGDGGGTSVEQAVN